MPNRLAQSQSLYLRKHAENPVSWWAWGDDAIATARQSNRPIFLSIGYSSCHWCTVMEREAFSDQGIAAYLNNHFLPIKVDREERPDLDSLYMQALQLMIGQRGWPLNIFLTPNDLVPFYGGTYFPVETRYGKPSFLKVLHSLHNLYITDRSQIDTIQAQIVAELQPSDILTSSAPLQNEDLLASGILESAKVLIPTDTGTSFPMVPYSLTALQGVYLSRKTVLDPAQICRQRALDLVLGGIFDHVAGGFHRYTVDPTWTVPHFEKMLYDNGLILEFLAEIERAHPSVPAITRAMELTVDWLKREMRDPAGYFYAAQDADSVGMAENAEPVEGAFYVWSAAELESLLDPSELTALQQAFMIVPGGNFEGSTVLQRRQSGALNESVKQGLLKLFQARYGTTKRRIPPVTDTKLIVAWNSLMISGLANAAIVLDQLDYLMLAQQAAQFIGSHQWQDGHFHRINYDGQPAVLAQAEDYVFLIKALVDLQQASLVFTPYRDQGAKWLEQAVAVQTELDADFWSDGSGGYFNTPRRFHTSPLSQERGYRDNATPSANGVAIANLIRLSLLTENLDYLHRAEQALAAFSAAMEQEPQACPSLFQALNWFQHQTLVKTSAEQIGELSKCYWPTVNFEIISTLPEGVVGFVCKGLTCLEPAMSLEQLKKQVLAKAA